MIALNVPLSDEALDEIGTFMSFPKAVLRIPDIDWFIKPDGFAQLLMQLKKITPERIPKLVNVVLTRGSFLILRKSLVVQAMDYDHVTAKELKFSQTFSVNYNGIDICFSNMVGMRTGYCVELNIKFEL